MPSSLEETTKGEKKFIIINLKNAAEIVSDKIDERSGAPISFKY